MEKLKIYGLKISYYTGKLEGYLRYKEIPHQFLTLNPERMKTLKAKTGAAQMPAIELPDGRFMTDTSPTIEWLENTYSNHPIIPSDPILRFFSFLLEDYAEEWLWRPAMHYRWSYKADREHLARKIVDELLAGDNKPDFLKRLFIKRRQHNEYVKQDGVDSVTWDHVESIYLNTLDRLNQIFLDRPYLLGEHPTLGDFGYFASMFRHFSQDPTASEIMRERAPAVFEWQARLWNATASTTEQTLVSDLPSDLDSTIHDIATGYLPYLNDNAIAWQKGESRFNPVIQGVQYSDVPVSQYRVWCLEQLQKRFADSPKQAQSPLRDLLTEKACWEPLFALEHPGSRYDEAQEAPFRGRKVHYHNRRD